MGRTSRRRPRGATGLGNRILTRSKGLDSLSHIPASISSTPSPPPSSSKKQAPPSRTPGCPQTRASTKDTPPRNRAAVDLATQACAEVSVDRAVRSVSGSSAEDIIPEIVVRTGDVDMMDLHESDAMSTSQGTDSPQLGSADPRRLSRGLLSAMTGGEQIAQPSFTSSMSALSDQSDLSSIPSSVSSKATTPVDLDGQKEAPPPLSISAAEEVARDPAPPPEEVTEVMREPPSMPPEEPPLELPPLPPAQAIHEASLPPQDTLPSSQAAVSQRSQSPKAPEPELSVPPPPPPKFRIRSGPNRRYDVRPKVSIPMDLSPQEYAVQCIGAAESSRLNPYALHKDEYLMLRDHISLAQITTYLNIRNGILRLWVRNPTISITREEAIGCAKDSRWFDVANLCFDWLVRQGYINFGCCEVRQSRKQHVTKEEADVDAKRRTVVVIGAGLSGLGCARQLEGLFAQYAKRFRERGEQPPKVVVLEGRSRVGGRVYSRPFRTRPAVEPQAFRGKRYTAEMGGMIVTGFERGNPINILVRGQLGLAYHALRSDPTLITIYDSNGQPVDTARDQLVEKLYNDCLDRVSEYKWKLPLPKLLQGNRDLIDEGKDSAAEVHKTISYVEEMTAAQPHAPPVSEQNIAPRIDMVPVSSDRVTGRVHVEPGIPGAIKASFKAQLMGWTLRQNVNDETDIHLDPAAKAPGATLGSVLDEAILQYKDLVDISPQDMRLINWHIANLEYSNASNLNQLSLEGWDMDVGNEWEGRHTMIVGGYQSLAMGLAQCPSPLDIQYKKAVTSITTMPPAFPASDAEPNMGTNGLYMIECEDGSTIEADYVVNTIPLGVLKHGDVEFNPPLPPWKTEVIERLGFGVLNKVILVYEKAFWEEDKDIFGVLRQSQSRASLNPKDYSSRRGRFFQWFNVTNTSGMPTLLALMAGDAAFDTEQTPNDELVAEATELLRSIFGPSAVPEPMESIVTRWGSDRFARGSYSSAGTRMRVEDYDVMSRPVGPGHFFAGEHTCGTHPATVHGAYMSGLRAASEVANAILGPIEVQMPLIVPKESASSSMLKRKAAEQPKDPRREAEEAYELRLWEHVRARIGDHPLEPPKMTTKAHLLFTRANHEAARQKCLEGRRPGKGPPSASEVRSMAAKMWNAAAEEQRRPFVEQVALLKEQHAAAVREYVAKAEDYGRRAAEVVAAYEKENPRPSFPDTAMTGTTETTTTLPPASATASPVGIDGRRAAKKIVLGKSTEPGDNDVEMTG